MVWKNREKVFHCVEILFPWCGKLMGGHPVMRSTMGCGAATGWLAISKAFSM
jgi:hypothetical protein